MATADEKAARQAARDAARQAAVVGQQRLAAEVPKAATAFPVRRLRSAGDLSRYAIGGFLDDPYALAPPAAPLGGTTGGRGGVKPAPTRTGSGVPARAAAPTTLAARSTAARAATLTRQQAQVQQLAQRGGLSEAETDFLVKRQAPQQPVVLTNAPNPTRTATTQLAQRGGLSPAETTFLASRQKKVVRRRTTTRTPTRTAPKPYTAPTAPRAPLPGGTRL